MYVVEAIPNTQEWRDEIGGACMPVFEGTQAECVAYVNTHNTLETSPYEGWNPQTDGELKIVEVL
tara:strand:- start:1418 stop:1612 length:195 start_codon:yes stop_codon:yes gene_type:complete